MTITMAVDLGSTGAYALFQDGEPFVLRDLPLLGDDYRRLLYGEELREVCITEPVDEIVIEWVHAMRTGSKANFGMGGQRAAFHMLADCAAIPCYEVKPARWKQTLGLTADKEQCRQRALAEYPAFANQMRNKGHHNRAEALLIGLAWQTIGQYIR